MAGYIRIPLSTEVGLGLGDIVLDGDPAPSPLKGYCSVLFLSHPRSEGWPHHGRTFSIYLCPLSFSLTLS